MPFATTNDGVRLYYEETGSGSAGDLRARVRRRPAELGAADAALRQALPLQSPTTPGAIRPPTCPRRSAHIRRRARRTTSARCLTIWRATKAHVVGLSMGGFATLHFGLRHPRRALSLCVGGCGYGAELDKRERFRAEADVIADGLRSSGMAGLRREICLRADARAVREQGPARVCRVQGDASRALGRGLREHPARRAARAALALRSRRGDEAASPCRPSSLTATRTGPACCQAS